MGALKRFIKWFVGPSILDRSEDQRAQWQAGLPSRQRYVCGFAFHGEPGSAPHVVLIRKIKPEWQAGKLNGVGGKIELGETPEQAMAREFNEEAGVHTLSIDWNVFARCEFRGAQVVFLRAFGNLFSCARTTTAETIYHCPILRLDIIPADGIIPNLRWLIPLAWHFEDTREVVTISYGQN